MSVFVAASTASPITVTLYDGVVDSASPPPSLATHTTPTTRFGEAFHAVVVTVQLPEANPLLPGHLYSYDVRVGDKSLKDLHLLDDSELPGYGSARPAPDPLAPDDHTNLAGEAHAPDGDGHPASDPVELPALGYLEGRLPSFVTCPADLGDLVLAHASCRKPHGLGTPALGLLDVYLDDLDQAIEGRPHMLFLTGDQIYADDVAAALLPGLTRLGFALLGGVEQIPSPKDATPIGLNAFPAGFRQRVTGRAHFTSEDSANHLIGFGEWLAMYCAAWNPEMWPVLAVADTAQLDTPAEIKAKLDADAAASPPNAPRVLGHPTPDDAPADVITPLYAGDEAATKALAAARETFLEEKALLAAFRREVPRVRRLLANVPTYMICDDHEVSDDWFMTGGIRSGTLGSPFGRALVRNALSAYTVCQAWGNNPAAWSGEQHHRDLLAKVAAAFPDGWDGGAPAVTTEIETLLGLAPGGHPQLDFSYLVDGPKHRVRVLDTRTRRQYDTLSTSPGLLDQAALDDQLPVEDLPDGNVLVVVSPAPVYGPPVVAEIGGAVGATVYDLVSMNRSETARAAEENLTGIPTGRPTGFQVFDTEHWGAHPAAFERLLERLSHSPRVVVLAGDVHYGAAFAMDWTAPAGGSPRTSRIVHFTSSPARNGWDGVVRNLMALNGMATGLQRIGTPMLRLGWSATLPPVVTDGLDVEPPLTKVRLRTGPVLLSDEMFRRSHPLQRPPEWLWRAEPVVDVRAPADRPEAARVPETAADLPGDRSAVGSYGDAMALHVQALTTAALARGLQFLGNAGLVTFTGDPGALLVSQALYSLRPRPQANEKGAAYIVHTTSLEPAQVPVPTTVGRAG